MKLSFGQIPEVGPGANGGEDLVVLAPDNQRRRFPFAKERLKLRVKRNVAPVVMEEVELDVLVAGTIQQRLVMRPIIRIDTGDVGYAVGVLELGGRGRNKKAQRLTVCVRTVGPVGLDWIPEFLETLLVGVAILNDKRGDAIRVLEGEAITDGRAVVHEIHRIFARI